MSEGPAAPSDDGDSDSEPEFELTEASGVGGPAVEAPPETPATPSRTTIPPEKAVEMLSKISLFSALQPSYLRRIANLGIGPESYVPYRNVRPMYLLDTFRPIREFI